MSQDRKVPGQPEEAAGFWRARYTLGVMGMLGLFNSFAMRVDLSVAIVAMVNQTAIVRRSADVLVDWEQDTCPGALENTTSHEASSANGEFLWDETKQAELLAAFFYGYTLGHIPCGALADRFGGKLMMGIAILVNALLTVFTPLIAWFDADVFFAARFLIGLTQAGQIPAFQNMVSKWVPPQERSRFSIAFFGSYLGIVLSMALTGVMCETAMGWPLAFYFFGALGLLWCLPWFLLAFDTPAKHPRIDPGERAYIEASLGKAPVKKRLPVPWGKVATTPALWACAIFQAGIGWVYNLLLTGLPLYMANILHFDLHSNGVLSSVPYITGGIGSLVFGGVLDHFIKMGCFSRINSYRIFNFIALVIPSMALIAVTVVGCESAVIVVLMAVNCMCMSAHFSSNYTNVLVLAPNFSGTLMGIVNTFANTMGIVVPYVVAAFTAGNQTRTAWNTVFYVSAAIGVMCSAFYMIFSTDKEQPWNDASNEKVEKNSREARGAENQGFDEERESGRGRPV